MGALWLRVLAGTAPRIALRLAVWCTTPARGPRFACSRRSNSMREAVGRVEAAAAAELDNERGNFSFATLE